MTHPLLARAEAGAFRRLMALPRPVMRVLAGRPVVLDGQTLDLETQWMLRLKQLTREKPVESLPIAEGRHRFDRQTTLVGGRSQSVGEVRDLDLPGGAGPVRARLYVPRSLAGVDAPAPLLVFFHGGGFIYGHLDSHDSTCRLLAERADVRVLSVDYRLAPEAVFPAAVDDCWAAYSWVVDHAGRFGADPERVGVAGDSAGGNLAAVVALRAAGARVPCSQQVLIYPMTNAHDPSASRSQFAEGFLLTRAFIDLADASHVPAGVDRRHPDVSVAYAERIPDDLAPAIIVTAGFDPLRDEGEAYARMLADAGVEVLLKRYPGLVHGFFNVAGVGRSQRAAVAEIAALVRSALH